MKQHDKKQVKRLLRHKRSARYIWASIPIMLLTIILSYIAVKNEWLLFLPFSFALYVAMVVAYVYYVLCEIKWRYGNYDIGEKMNLNHLRIYDTGTVTHLGTPIMEMHHKAQGIKHALTLRNISKKEIIAQMKREFQTDFNKIDSYMKDNAIALIITTHPSFAHILQDSIKGIATMQKANIILDPLGKMNRIEWVIASLYTTGRINRSRPTTVDTYYFDFGDDYNG